MADEQPITSDNEPFELAPPPLGKKEGRRAEYAAEFKHRYANDPEFRAMIQARNAAWRDKPGISEKRKQHYKEYRSDPEKRAKEAARKKEYCARPEVKAKTAEYEKAFYDDPARKAAMLEQAKEYRRQEKVKQRLADWSRKRKYGISPEQYASMLAATKGRCPICRTMFADSPRDLKPVVDHCHKTGVVRGVICLACNRALSALLDKPKLLRAAARYLERASKDDFTCI
jgi:hypothetical protein